MNVGTSFEQKKDCIEQMLIWLGKTSDNDIKSIAEMVETDSFHFSGKLARYEVVKELESTIKLYLSGELDAAFVTLRKCVYALIDTYNIGNSTSEIRKYANFLDEACNYIDICDEYIKIFNNKEKENLSLSNIPTDDNITLNAQDILAIKNSIDSKYFHLYKYRTGNGLPETTKFELAKNIIASNNLEKLISGRVSNDAWSITVGLFIEKKIDLSYFVITFSLNGNVYVLTDKFIYQNPDQINRLRNGGRRFSEDRENKLDFLPYILIDKVIENREKAKTLANQNCDEIWTFPIDEYLCNTLYYIIGYTIEKIVNGYDVKQVLGANANLLQLTDGNVNMSDDSHFSKTNIDKLNELVKEIFEEDTTALVVQNKQLLEQMGVSSTLMTVEEFEKNTQYLAHKQVAEQHIRNRWGDKYEVKFDSEYYYEYAKQRDLLLGMFKDKIKLLEPFLFAGDKVYLHDRDHPFLYGIGWSATPSYRYKNNFVITGKDRFNLIPGCIDHYVYCVKNDGFKVKKEQFKTFSFMRYTEIATILNIRRNELPPLFRDYLSHYYIPYSGNCILDNVKPEFTALEQDYASQRNVNCFDVSFPFCGYCARKLFKKYKVAEEAVIVISSKQNQVFEILPKEDFERKYIQ